MGFVLPAGTPTVLVDRINREINRAMQTQDAKDRFSQRGMETARSNSAEFGVFLRDEVAKWAGVVKSTGARVE